VTFEVKAVFGAVTENTACLVFFKDKGVALHKNFKAVLFVFHIHKFSQFLWDNYSAKLINGANDACFLQLKLNYDKLSQSFPSGDYTSVLDLLETIIYYYDTYSDKEFKRLLKGEKNNDIRAFIMEVCVFIKNDNPFISSPPKEAEMMRTIKDALHNNNTKLGINSLIQLSREVETKEKLLAKKEKENQIATIISVVGIILTLFFGFFSVLPFFTSQ